MIVAGLAIWRGLSSLAKMAVGGVLVLLVVLLFYEGIGPWETSRPFSWLVPKIGISGRVDRVRDAATAAADARCAADKEASRVAAEKFDGEEQARHLASMAKQLQDAQRRADDVQSAFDRYRADTAADDAAEVAAGRRAGCEPLTRRGSEGLQPRQLPYPGAGHDTDRGTRR